MHRGVVARARERANVLPRGCIQPTRREAGSRACAEVVGLVLRNTRRLTVKCHPFVCVRVFSISWGSHWWFILLYMVLVVLDLRSRAFVLKPETQYEKCGS